jgi:tetratricopeptide (TPR) repeat protein
VGFLGSSTQYDPVLIDLAISKIDQGIKRYPDRLDMRFGKIYILGEVGAWQRFTDEIVSAIRHSAQNQNNWTWTNHTKQPEAKSFFLNGLQDYQYRLYSTGDDSLLSNMRTIASEVLKIYPDHVESLSNLAITSLLAGKYDEAIEILLKAEKLSPSDPIILGNIAEGYRRNGDKQKAIFYFEKVMKLGDEQTVSYCQAQIAELSK